MTSRIGAALRPASLALALAALTSSPLAAPPGYQVQVLPVPGSGHWATTATAINRQGVVGVNQLGLAQAVRR